MQAQFNALAASLAGENAHFAFFYDESLSHLIYAGCDIIAVPSMFEPCGLTQVKQVMSWVCRPLLIKEHYSTYRLTSLGGRRCNQQHWGFSILTQ